MADYNIEQYRLATEALFKEFWEQADARIERHNIRTQRALKLISSHSNALQNDINQFQENFPVLVARRLEEMGREVELKKQGANVVLLKGGRRDG
jgi:hypothetical protein